MIGVDGRRNAEQLHNGAPLQLGQYRAAFRLPEVYTAVGNGAGCAGGSSGIRRRCIGGSRTGCGGSRGFAGLHRIGLPRNGFRFRHGGEIIPMNIAHIRPGIAVIRVFHRDLIPGKAFRCNGIHQLAHIPHINPEPIVRCGAGLLTHADTVGNGFAVGSHRLGRGIARHQGQKAHQHNKSHSRCGKPLPPILHHDRTSVFFPFLTGARNTRG